MPPWLAPPEMPPRILARKRFDDHPPGALPGPLPACVAAARRVPAAPLSIAPSRCNRCGACLRTGCGAISDEGGEALVIDPAACAGGGLCAGACRGRAIG